MTASRPDDFPSYGMPWLLVEIIDKFTSKLRYEPIRLAWSETCVAVLLIGEDPDFPKHELEITYDGVRKLSVRNWGWVRQKHLEDDAWLEDDEWGIIEQVEYDLLESEDIDNLTKFLKEHIKDKNVKLQYPPSKQSKS